MAPHHRADIHQSRDGDSDSILNRPAVVLVGLFVLCFCIMAPMIWMLWMMRKDNFEEIMVEERLNRVRNWKHIVAEERQQRQQQQQQQVTHSSVVQDMGHKVGSIVGKIRLSSSFSKLYKLTISIHRAVALQSQAMREKISQRFTSITRTVPHRNRSQSRTGVSIDLPIMRQPAWQKLASGSAGVTPSTTVGDLPRPASLETQTTGMAGPDGYRQATQSGSQVAQGPTGHHGHVNGASGAELQQPLAANTVGLAMG